MNSTEKGNELFTFVHHLNGAIEDILDSRNYVEEPNRFLYTLIHKMRSLLDASSLLLMNIDGKPHYIDSLALVLRTCLLDSINIYYVLDCAEQPEESQRRVHEMLSDHVYSLLKTSNDSEKVDIKNKYPQYWAADDKKAFKKPFNGDMVKAISTFEHVKQEADNAYRIYSIFSKYEHNGEFSFDLLLRQYSSDGHAQLKGLIFDAVDISGMALMLAVKVWIEPNNEHYKGMEEMIKKLLKR